MAYSRQAKGTLSLHYDPTALRFPHLMTHFGGRGQVLLSHGASLRGYIEGEKTPADIKATIARHRFGAPFPCSTFRTRCSLTRLLLPRLLVCQGGVEGGEEGADGGSEPPRGVGGRGEARGCRGCRRWCDRWERMVAQEGKEPVKVRRSASLMCGTSPLALHEIFPMGASERHCLL